MRIMCKKIRYNINVWLEEYNGIKKGKSHLIGNMVKIQSKEEHLIIPNTYYTNTTTISSLNCSVNLPSNLPVITLSIFTLLNHACFLFKGTLMQIWKSPYMFVFISSYLAVKFIIFLTLIWVGVNFTPLLVFPEQLRNGKSCNPGILQHSITFY